MCVFVSMDRLSGRGNVHGSNLLSVDQNEILKLARVNAHPRDSQIAFFEEAHIYEINGVAAKRSVTALVSKPFSKFDAKASAARIAKRLVKTEENGAIVLKNPYTKSDKQYHKMALDKKASSSKDVAACVQDVWIESTNEGTRLHRAIELHLNDELIPQSYQAPEFRNFYLKDFLDFVRKEKFECFRTEWVIFSDQVSLAGSVDCVMRKCIGPCPRTGEPIYEYYIFDWKRSKKIYFKSFGGKKFGKGRAFQSLIDCNYSKYSLQLNVYRHMLEVDYGLPIKGLFLFVFHPWNSSFVKIEVPRMEKETAALFAAALPPIVVLLPSNVTTARKQPFDTDESTLDDLKSRLGDLWVRNIFPDIIRTAHGKPRRVHVHLARAQLASVAIIAKEICNLEKIVDTVSDPPWFFQIN